MQTLHIILSSPYHLIIIVACSIMDDARYTISKWVGSTMTMSTKVQKSFFVIKTLLIHSWMWKGKKLETFFSMCTSLYKAIVSTISWRIWWVMVHSFPKHWNKWIPKWWMVCSPLKCERCAFIGCNVVRKWIENKQNVGVIMS